MHTLTVKPPPTRLPVWFWTTAAVGVSWNLFGAVQFATSFSQTVPSLMAAGMTQAQAEVYLALPAWISVVFAIGVLGGLLGSVALALRRRVAKPIFAASLVGYLLLFAGDTYHGVFAAIPSQLAILGVVVTVAAVLWGMARLADRRSMLN